MKKRMDTRIEAKNTCRFVRTLKDGSLDDSMDDFLDGSLDDFLDDFLGSRGSESAVKASRRHWMGLRVDRVDW